MVKNKPKSDAQTPENPPGLVESASRTEPDYDPADPIVFTPAPELHQAVAEPAPGQAGPDADAELVANLKEGAAPNPLVPGLPPQSTGPGGTSPPDDGTGIAAVNDPGPFPPLAPGAAHVNEDELGKAAGRRVDPTMLRLIDVLMKDHALGLDTKRSLANLKKSVGA